MSRRRDDEAEAEASFYEAALMAGAMDATAEPVDDLSDVIGDLRRRLRDQLYERPDDVRLMLRSADSLSRAATTRQGLSMQSKRRLAANMDRLMEELDDLLKYPHPKEGDNPMDFFPLKRDEG